jgi:hypothetical protein
MKYFIFLLTILFFYSCGEDIPRYAEVLSVDMNSQKVSYKKVEIKGIKSLSDFESERFKYLSNAKIRTYITQEEADSFNIETATVDEINKLTYKDKGVAPSIRFTVKEDTIIPYTLEDSILLTLHYNLRESIDFFISNGLNIDEGMNGKPYGQINVFYELNIEAPSDDPINPESDAIKDNAMYYPLLNSLAFLKQDEYKHLALVSNPMVITHEFAHSIFAYASEGVLEGSDVYSNLLDKNCNDVHNSFYKAGMNEGFSDYWSSRKTGSADLFYLSITKEEMGVDTLPLQDRSLENNRNLTSDMLIYSTNPQNCQDEAASKSYYWAGTIWASALWEAEKTVNIEDFDKYLLKSYACLYTEFSNSFSSITMATPGDCFVKTLKQEITVNQNDIDTICSIFKRRFSIISGEFNECN